MLLRIIIHFPANSLELSAEGRSHETTGPESIAEGLLKWV